MISLIFFQKWLTSEYIVVLILSSVVAVPYLKQKSRLSVLLIKIYHNSVIFCCCRVVFPLLSFLVQFKYFENISEIFLEFLLLWQDYSGCIHREITPGKDYSWSIIFASRISGNYRYIEKINEKRYFSKFLFVDWKMYSFVFKSHLKTKVIVKWKDLTVKEFLFTSLPYLWKGGQK